MKEDSPCNLYYKEDTLQKCKYISTKSQSIGYPRRKNVANTHDVFGSTTTIDMTGGGNHSKRVYKVGKQYSKGWYGLSGNFFLD